MTSSGRQRQSGYTLFELAICVAVLAALAGLLLVRVQAYSAQAERAAVNQLVETLRTALQLRISDAKRTGGKNSLSRLLDENPLDWLDRKPDNYVGEYYAPEIEKIPPGNWLFDRRDKTLKYLPSSRDFYSISATKFLRFKVESAQLLGRIPVQEGRAQELAGLELQQLSDQAPAGTSGN
jgi:general secretion pathway protein G